MAPQWSSIKSVLVLDGERLVVEGETNLDDDTTSVRIVAMVTQQPVVHGAPGSTPVGGAADGAARGEVLLTDFGPVRRAALRASQGGNVEPLARRELVQRWHFKSTFHAGTLEPGLAYAKGVAIATNSQGHVHQEDWGEWVVIRKKSSAQPSQPPILAAALDLADNAVNAADVKALLQNLQPNILRPHVRTRLELVFLRVTDRDTARAKLREIAELHMKSAAGHFAEIKEFREDPKEWGDKESIFVGVGLSARGYAKLGVESSRTPDDPRFLAGMQASTWLNDPDPSEWKDYAAIDAVLIVGGNDPTATTKKRDRLVDILGKGFACGPGETGDAIAGKDQPGCESFGFVDGRSQPLLKQDSNREKITTDGTSQWSPSAALRYVLLDDPGVTAPATAGVATRLRGVTVDAAARASSASSPAG